MLLDEKVYTININKSCMIGYPRSNRKLQQYHGDTKHPILINSHHQIVKLIVTHVHISNKHVGKKQTLLSLRQKFWIFRGCSFIRKILTEYT